MANRRALNGLLGGVALCVLGMATGCDGAAANGSGSEAIAPSEIAFSPPSGTFMDSVSVTLTTSLGGAEVRYTTDGTPPTATSALYDGSAVSVSTTTELRAQSFQDGMPVGIGSTGLYLARSFDFSGDLPLVVMDSYGTGPLDQDSRDFVPAAFLVLGASGSASLSAPAALASRSGFHVRGQSSATFDKKPYRVELWDEANEDRDLPVLGMAAEADWALIGPRADDTLLRHPFAYDLGREMGLFAPHYAFVEFYLNVEARPLNDSDYQGVYLVVETIKNAKNRLNLQQLKPDDMDADAISGGYIFKFETAAAEEPLLRCEGANCWSDLEVQDPSDLAPVQRAWLTDYVQRFQDALHGPSIADPVAGYPAFIDVASFVDQFILFEFTKNVDAYVRSTYFYKDRDGLVFAGPLWDYDLSLGAGFDFGGINNLTPDGWMYPQRTQGVSDWYPLLYAEPGFAARVRTRWAELRGGLLSEAQLNARVDRMSAPLVAAAARNFARWGAPGTDPGGATGGGFGGGGGPLAIFTGPSAPTWDGQLQALKDWMAERVTWLDSQWAN